jgi:hypothetical protein
MTGDGRDSSSRFFVEPRQFVFPMRPLQLRHCFVTNSNPTPIQIRKRGTHMTADQPD